MDFIANKPENRAIFFKCFFIAREYVPCMHIDMNV